VLAGGAADFFFWISLLLVLVGLLLLPMRTREEIFVSHKIYFHGTTTTTRWKAAEMLTIKIASLSVNNLEIVTKVGL